MDTATFLLKNLSQPQASGNGCFSTANIAIICGAIVCLLALYLLCYMTQKSHERKMAAQNNQKEAKATEHTWAVEKDKREQEEALQERNFKKKHEYTQELLKFYKENGDKENYVNTLNKIIEELRTEHEQ